MEKTIIKSVHEETYSDGRTIGVLVNYHTHNMKKCGSFIYIFREDDNDGMYIFFETIIDMNDYMLYGDKKIKRAYMKETTFDEYFDNGIDREFNDLLVWVE